MKYIDKKISDSYYQIYIILDNSEKQAIYKNVKKAYLEYKQDDLKAKLSIYKNISAKAESSLSIDMIRKISQELKYLSLDTIYLNEAEIAEGISGELILDIIKHIDSLGLSQVFNKEVSLIGSMDDNNSITLVYSFCYVPLDYPLNLPKQKGNAYLFTSQDLEMIETEMLIGSNYYEKRSVDKVSEFSDITFTYIKGDTVQKDVIMDVSSMELAFNIDRSKLVGLDKNTHILENNNGEVLTLIIEDISDKDIYEIDDEIVKKLNFLDTKTVKEFRDKITSIYSYVLNVNSNVMSLLKNMTKINDFQIDEYVLKHYCKKVEIEYNDHVLEDNIKEIKIGFITSLIFSKYNINIDKYVPYIQDEYELISKMKKVSGDKSFDEYFGMKAPIYALYDFFKSKNLVTERS